MQRILRNTDKNLIDITHNSYLNLHKNSILIKHSKLYIDKFSTSFTTSPLIGNSQVFEEIFEKFYQIYNKKCLIFPSGFQTNISVIPALIKHFNNPLVIFDKLNHNSMYQGLKLSPKHTLKRYKNCDLNHLESILKANINEVKIVFTEAVFSMDGTVLDIDGFMYLKNKYNFVAYIDEAHSLGVFGQDGYGLSYKYKDEIEVIMATFSKSLASQGGFVLTSEEMQKYLINNASGLIYSTGLSPANIGAACKALELLPKMSKERESILNLAKKLNSKSQIVPIILSNKDEVFKYHADLLNNDILTSTITHPTVPIEKPRIRICINSEIDFTTVKKIKNILKII